MQIVVVLLDWPEPFCLSSAHMKHPDVKEKHCRLGVRRCLICAWAKHSQAWQAQFPWLGIHKSTDGVSLTCIQCQMPICTVRKRCPTRQQFLKHEGSKVHRCELAPSVDEFRATWTDVRGKRCRELDTPSGATFGSKRRRVICCMGEAVRRQNRRFLKDATCMTISQDARKARLLTRFTAVTCDLQTRSGILGLVRGYDTGHRGLMNATKKTYTDLCTPLNGAPACLPQTETDTASLQHLRSITKVWNSDAAADELLTGQELRTAAV